jgi:hypothetical protein
MLNQGTVEQLMKRCFFFEKKDILKSSEVRESCRRKFPAGFVPSSPSGFLSLQPEDRAMVP